MNGEQTAINFNPPKLSPQCQKLYNRLLKGSILNTQIRDELGLLEYRRRFKDLRDKYGIPTEMKPLGHGVNEYSLKKDTSYETEMDRATKYIEKYK